MTRPLLLSLLLMTAAVPTWATSSPPATTRSATTSAGESALQTALPAGCKATLHFERTKVAAGAIANEAHQSAFWVEVRDAKGQPKSGVALALPQITKGGQGNGSSQGDGVGADNRIVARLEWLPSTPRAASAMVEMAPALTGADGRARGLFTSGKRTQTVEISGVGGAKATIDQVWNEVEESVESDGILEDELNEVRFTLRFHDGQKWVPITGHKIHLTPSSVRVLLSRPNRDEDAENEMDEADEADNTVTFSNEKPEAEGWKTWLHWSDFTVMAEVEPGIYVGNFSYKLPAEATIDGKNVDGVDNVGYDVSDSDAWENE